MKLNKKTIPNVPGVYFFRDKRGRILYIGKAVNLRNRLKSYFPYRDSNPRIAKMLELAARVNWQETGSEIEALIVESRLIKKYHPLFNIMLRDDKQYFYVGFT
ncbi:MAG: GIY-YIG nuclease family protein, partial [Candidatus Yanofskybacteria bacterium]|nr:GIY-YIG nuclease family protein [Candidatus Yanofskybacteria bacterium]